MVFDKIFGAFAFTNGGTSSGGTAFELIAVIVLTVLIAYIVGVMISHIVDKKLGNIEIQIPNINVNSSSTPSIQAPQLNVPQPPPQIVFRISEDAEGKINLQPLNGGNIKSTRAKNCKPRENHKIITPKENPFNHPNRIQTVEPFLSVDFEETQRDDVKRGTPKIKSRLQSDDVPYKDYTQSFVVDTLDYPIVVETETPPTEVRTAIGCTTDSDCNNVYGGGRNVCKADGTCHCVSGSGIFCHLGSTFYKDPKDMTPEERARFKLKFRNNMTLQDYKNWLMLYKDEIEVLRQHHRRNLIKLMKGGQLTVRDVPNIRLKPPTDAADYFNKMYVGGKISVHFPDNDSPLVGSNYTQYTDFIPPENAGSSWITGAVDLFKESGKDDAKALNYYLRPDTTVGIDEESVGDVYQRYLKKHHQYSDLRKIARVIDENERAQIPQRQDKSLQTFSSRDLNVGMPQ